MEALEDLTGLEMERLLRRLAEGGGPWGRPLEERAGAVNPAFDPERFEAMGRT